MCHVGGVGGGGQTKNVFYVNCKVKIINSWRNNDELLYRND